MPSSSSACTHHQPRGCGTHPAAVRRPPLLLGMLTAPSQPSGAATMSMDRRNNGKEADGGPSTSSSCKARGNTTLGIRVAHAPMQLPRSLGSIASGKVQKAQKRGSGALRSPTGTGGHIDRCPDRKLGSSGTTGWRIEEGQSRPLRPNIAAGGTMFVLGRDAPPAVGARSGLSHNLKENTLCFNHYDDGSGSWVSIILIHTIGSSFPPIHHVIISRLYRAGKIRKPPFTRHYNPQ